MGTVKTALPFPAGSELPALVGVPVRPGRRSVRRGGRLPGMGPTDELVAQGAVEA
jgi:hypothetical protein